MFRDRERRPSPPPLKLLFSVMKEPGAAVGDVQLQRDRNNRIRLRLGDTVSTEKRGAMKIVSVYWETNHRGHVLLRPT